MTKLYKYKSFGVNLLNLLYQSEIYYSDPKEFNDPLDCSPVLINNTKLRELEILCHRMILNNSGQEKADGKINNYQYLSTEYGDYNLDKEVHSYYVGMITDEIKYQLDLIMKNRGVLSLSSLWDCPLMWSHYADEHKGVCVEYDISGSVCEKPIKIDYTSGRGILISDLVNWILNDSEKAKTRVENKYFYSKAGQWSYEEEWRYVSKLQGCQSLQFPITGIYFGMRSDISVISSIVKLMSEAKPTINFFKTSVSNTSFEILKREIDIDELLANTPRPPASLLFGKLTSKQLL